jgi:hypothetical protein
MTSSSSSRTELLEIMRLTLPILIALALPFAACQDSAGSACSLDSDCETGLLCHPFDRICVAPLCDSQGVCTLQDVTTADTASDAADADATPDAEPVDDTGAPVGDVAPADAAGDVDAMGCDVPGAFPGPTWKVTSFAIGANGKKGAGLDVDGDAATCAPAVSCEAGIDNGFANVGTLANGFLKKAVDAGDVTLAFYLNEQAGSLWVLDAEAKGGSLVPDVAITWGDCGPKSTVPGASLAGGELTTEDGGSFIIPLALLGATLRVPISDVEVEGTVSGKKAALVMAGALAEATLLGALAELPSEAVGGLTLQQLEDLVKKSYTVDLDTDGDGKKESISVGLVFEAEQAELEAP